MGNWWAAVLQSHGHAQLLGWTGLFIVGVSLYFLPRLAGRPLRYPRLLPWTLLLLTSGIVFRTTAQPLLTLSLPISLHQGLRVVLGISALLEAAGVVGYLTLLIGTIRGVAARRQAFHSIRIFLILSVTGWICHTAIVSFLILRAAWAGESLVDIGWNRLAIDLFVSLVHVPVAMVISARTFPLYLRLPAIDWPINRVGVVYLFALLLIHLSSITRLGGLIDGYANQIRMISAIGFCLKGSVILVFTWKLDLHLRRRPPWTVNLMGEPGPERRPTRPGLPDYGEFGAFELLLFGAFTALAIAAGLELVTGLAGLAGWTSFADPDAIRHTYLAGFVSMLILGMAPRMIPGFLRKRQVAYPRMVLWTFWLSAAAALFRVGPLFLADVLEALSWGMIGATTAFGLSGILGWSAVAILGWNLLSTWNLEADVKQ